MREAGLCKKRQKEGEDLLIKEEIARGERRYAERGREGKRSDLRRYREEGEEGEEERSKKV